MVLSGCGEEETPKGSDGEYFPLQAGFYQVYSVEKTVYSEVNPTQTFLYELKTEVVDSFANQEGGLTFVIHISTRATESEPWQFQEVWSARTNQYQAVMTEGNISYVRISFPAIKSKEWNGNALNSLGEDDYQFDGVGVSYELDNELEFSDALIINQHDELTLLIRDRREEVYARNVGLIYKSTSDLVYCNDGQTPAEGGCVGLYIIKSGTEMLQMLKEYGQN